MNELEEIHAMYDMTVAQFSGASDVSSGHFVVKNLSFFIHGTYHHC